MSFNLLVLLAVVVEAAASALVAQKTVATERTGASVPAQFHGNWRLSLTECPPAIIDRPIWISATKVRLDHSVGDVRVIRLTSKRDVTIAGDLLSEGNSRNAKLRLQLSGSGSALRMSEGDWSIRLQRCSTP